MKLLFENWREFVKQEVEEFLPHGEVRAVEMIGSSALSPEERAKQDLEKYGFVQDDDERDIDIEVQIAGITREEAEEWAFSDEADELEFNYNYDVQLRIVENWRKFMSEDVDPKMKKYLKKHPYMEPDQLQEEAAGQCFPFAVEMANAVPDNEFDDMSKFKVVHGRITDKFSGETTLHAWVEKGDVVFDWQTSATKPKGISKVSYYDIFQPEVHAEYTAEELLVNCMKQGHKGPFNLSEDLQGEAVEDVYTGNCGMFGIALAEEAQRRGVDASLVFAHNADTDQELAYGDYKLYHVALKIGDKYYDGRGEIQLKELVSFMWEKPEDMNVDAFNLKNLELMKDAIRRNTAWTQTCEYYREQASEFLDEMGYEALSEESEFQTKMKKNLPAELDFLLNKGPHNKKEGPGVKNPPKPKFKSAPPGAPGGKRNDD